MVKIIILLTMFVVLVGTILVYDARNIVKVKFKNVKNQNKVVTYMKFTGVILIVISLTIIYVITR